MSENLYSYQQKMMLNKMKIFIVFLFSVFVSFSTRATELPMDIAVLRGLDKVTGRISTFSIPVGQTGTFGRTFVVPEACYTRPPEESPENSAFLYVFEKSLKGENIELFKGWMFSSNPALSSMEHPVYDIWVIACEKNSKIEEKKQNVKSEEGRQSKISQQKVIEKIEIKSEDEEPSSVLPQYVPSDVEMEEL